MIEYFFDFYAKDGSCVYITAPRLLSILYICVIDHEFVLWRDPKNLIIKLKVILIRGHAQNRRWTPILTDHLKNVLIVGKQIFRLN